MACINMYNPEAASHQGGAGGSGLISPRISFSNDLVLDQSSPSGSIKHKAPPSYCPSDPSTPDFEFSSGQQGQLPMIAADEAFFKGRLVPLRESPVLLQRVTLRDELVAGAVSDEDDSFRAPAARPSSLVRWRELLGLRKSASSTASASETSSARRLVDKMLADCGKGHDTGTAYYDVATVHVAWEPHQEGRRTTEGASPAARQRNGEIET